MAGNEEREEINLADHEEREEETFSRGVDWEVVSLTASAYAAAPGVDMPETTTIENNEKENVINSESSAALFMSGHFKYSPSEHENLPQEHDTDVIYPLDAADGTVTADSNERKLQIEYDSNLHSIEFSDKEHGVHVQDVGFNEGGGSQQPGLVGREQGIFVMDHSVSFQSGAHKRETEECLTASEGSPQDHRKTEDEHGDAGPPGQAWWKKHAASLYHHARECNTFWSIFAAATVMGLAVLGHRWKQENWQLHQIKWRFSMNEARMSGMLGPIGRFKDVLVGGHQPRQLLVQGVGASVTTI